MSTPVVLCVLTLGVLFVIATLELKPIPAVRGQGGQGQGIKKALNDAWRLLTDSKKSSYPLADRRSLVAQASAVLYTLQTLHSDSELGAISGMDVAELSKQIHEQTMHLYS